MDLNQLVELAEARGITIARHHGGQPGYWLESHRMISIREGLHPWDAAAQLAHELGHAALGHMCGATGMLHSRQERQADEYAANLLISPTDYRLAETMYGPNPGALAYHLETTRWIIEAWQDSNRALTRA